ncbi:MAG: TetR/AcrR family transcriptional regulator [Desulfuromonadales bacterium]|nr:TetR/AcrR family transcriptional regulator [Desulfuromonadales bacterium]
MSVANSLAARTKKPRRIDPQEKMTRVMQTARRLFVQKGYHNVSIPAIVQASEVSTGAIYSYFPNKEALAKHIHEQTLADFHLLFQARLDGRQSTYEKLRAFAEVVYETAEQDPEMMEYLLFMRHAEFMHDCIPLCFTEPFRLIQAIVRDGIAAGDLRPGDFLVSAISFTGAILRPVELRLQCVLEKSLGEMAEELFANAWAAIRA